MEQVFLNFKKHGKSVGKKDTFPSFEFSGWAAWPSAIHLKHLVSGLCLRFETSLRRQLENMTSFLS
jgi:hypothetical protein